MKQLKSIFTSVQRTFTLAALGRTFQVLFEPDRRPPPAIKQFLIFCTYKNFCLRWQRFPVTALTSFQPMNFYLFVKPLDDSFHSCDFHCSPRTHLWMMLSEKSEQKSNELRFPTIQKSKYFGLYPKRKNHMKQEKTTVHLGEVSTLNITNILHAVGSSTIITNCIGMISCTVCLVWRRGNWKTDILLHFTFNFNYKCTVYVVKQSWL